MEWWWTFSLNRQICEMLRMVRYAKGNDMQHNKHCGKNTPSWIETFNFQGGHYSNDMNGMM